MRLERNAAKYLSIMGHRKCFAVGRIRPLLAVLAALLATGFVATSPVVAKKQKPQPCPDEVYDLAGDVLGRGGITLAVQGRSIALAGFCETRAGAR